jgi:hypothetical protein
MSALSTSKTHALIKLKMHQRSEEERMRYVFLRKREEKII